MKFIIESKKSRYEITQILQKNTSRSFFCRNYDEFFNGKIFEESFKIQRNINYRNSFLPVIKGSIKETEYGTKIEIQRV